MSIEGFIDPSITIKKHPPKKIKFEKSYLHRPAAFHTKKQVN